MEKSCNDVFSVNNSGISNENATDENKERPMIIRSYPKSPIRNSEFDDLFNLELQSTPCYQPKEKYAVFQKYFPSNDDHDLSLISGDSQQQSGLWIRTKCSSTGSSSGNDSY